MHVIIKRTTPSHAQSVIFRRGQSICLLPYYHLLQAINREKQLSVSASINHHKSKPTSTSTPQAATKPNHHECRHAAAQHQQIAEQLPRPLVKQACPYTAVLLVKSFICDSEPASAGL